MNEYISQAEALSDEQPLEPDGELPEPTVHVLIANEQSTLAIDDAQLRAAVLAVFRESPYGSGSVSLAVVDDPTIHEINRRYLQHDYPTDVLSFVLEDRSPYLEGELVVSTDTAARSATEFGWPPSNELLLYVIHGGLHLVGYRDTQPAEIAEMRAAEAKHLRDLGVTLPIGATRWSGNEVLEKSAGEVSSS